MILVGMDDTDTIDSRGTNQLAKASVRHLADRWRCLRIVRHQLFFDSRVPYTSKNGSASLLFEPKTDGTAEELFASFREEMKKDFVPGSDPGLALATDVVPAIIEWGHRCQQQLVTKDQAIQIAAESGVMLEGLGGTNDGIIGALAAIGLAQTANDGRIVYSHRFPEDLSGQQSIERLRSLEVCVRNLATREIIPTGIIDVGKKLRPNLVHSETVLWAEETAETLRAIKKV